MQKYTVRIYSKPGCGKCEAAKQKMLSMDVSHTSIDVSDIERIWTQNKQIATDAKSAVEMYTGHVPIFEINGKLYDYPGAMKCLKIMQKAKSSEPCGSLK